MGYLLTSQVTTLEGKNTKCPNGLLSLVSPKVSLCFSRHTGKWLASPKVSREQETQLGLQPTPWPSLGVELESGAIEAELAAFPGWEEGCIG